MPIRRQPTGTSRHSVRLLALVMVVALAACAEGAGPGETLPARIGDLRPVSLREIDASTLAAEAVDADALAALLQASDFQAAAERSYRGTDPGIRRVDVLIARFGSADQADRFVAWQRTHVADVIGNAASTHAVGGVPIHVHLPEGCCAKEQVVTLAVWARGPDVIRVVVAGPDADGPEGTSVVRDLLGAIPPDA